MSRNAEPRDAWKAQASWAPTEFQNAEFGSKERGPR